MITPEKAEQDYQAAIAILGRIATAPENSGAERSAARSAAAELTFNYLQRVELEIHALTAQYQQFIASINDLVAPLQGGTSPVGAINGLKKIIATGAQFIGVASGAVPAGARSLAKGKRVARVLGSTGSGPIRILCVHGVGHQEKDPAFENGWRDAIAAGLGQWSMARPFEIQFVAYDHLFARAPLSEVDLAEAVFKLTASGIVHGIGDLFRKSRGLGDISDSLRWTAGMVAQWAENDDLRGEACAAVRDHIKAFQPDAILAHSLGSLIGYDLFKNPTDANLLKDRVLVTFGSQIGNPFVRDALGGRIEVIPPANRWFHLYNAHDRAFAAQLRMRAENFRQVTTEFDAPGVLDHDALQYLGHANTRATVWRYLAQGQTPAGARALGVSVEVIQKQATLGRKTRLQPKPKQRALLVGINDYPDPANRLEGCVNDVFLMSSVLQECGFAAEDIRVVLNDRATAQGVLERIDWLLDGAEDGQNRVLFYSGHGAQLPGYGPHETVDRVDECLVTYDFDWSREHAVTDDQFYELYSQLPDEANFLAVFDCCHSGGLTRDSGLRARGLNPPDDIRHRALRWNAEAQMWENRMEPDATEDKTAAGKKADLPLRKLGHRSYVKARTTGSKAYRPILLQACQEKQFSYEYRHGVTSYGAFTYSLAQIFRNACQESAHGKRRKLITWKELVTLATQRLRQLRYDQTPILVCPSKLARSPIPWK